MGTSSNGLPVGRLDGWVDGWIVRWPATGVGSVLRYDACILLLVSVSVVLMLSVAAVVVVVVVVATVGVYSSLFLNTHIGFRRDR